MKTDQEKAYEWFLKRAVTMPGAKEMYKTAVDASVLWYLTRPMRDDEKPETHTFKADTEWGVFEGTVTIVESR